MATNSKEYMREYNRRPDVKLKDKLRHRKRTNELTADYHLRTKYGITLAEKIAMYERQNGLCVCGQSMGAPRRAHVDHHHGSGRVRGLLCTRCNTAIGMAMDDPVILRRLADYVEWGPTL